MTISLEEFKTVCKEIKLLQPVQKVISSFLAQKWEFLQEKLGEKVNVVQLQKFAVSCLLVITFILNERSLQLICLKSDFIVQCITHD